MKMKTLPLKLVTISALLMSISVHAQTITGKVVSIADGDTIIILNSSKQQTKIRLYGIDTQEILKAGYAWQYRKYCKVLFCADWLRLEEDARHAGRGLWADKSPQLPLVVMGMWRVSLAASAFITGM